MPGAVEDMRRAEVSFLAGLPAQQTALEVDRGVALLARHGLRAKRERIFSWPGLSCSEIPADQPWGSAVLAVALNPQLQSLL
jgi:hypothetical protein